MKADLEALAKLIQPVTEDEARVLGALEWLSTERLPDSIRAHFIRSIEDVLVRVVPAEDWASLQGCGDAARYRSAFDNARAKGLFKQMRQQ